VSRQPSVFLTAAALAGSGVTCGASPAALALNGDGTVNSPSNPAAAGSAMTIFLNGVAPGAALSGTARTFYGITPITLTSGPPPANNGALPVSFVLPQSSGYALIQLQAAGTTARETMVAVCVQPPGANN
jgi:hypothetical protein